MGHGFWIKGDKGWVTMGGVGGKTKRGVGKWGSKTTREKETLVYLLGANVVVENMGVGKTP